MARCSATRRASYTSSSEQQRCGAGPSPLQLRQPALVPQLHGEADDRLAAIVQNRRDGRAVDAPAHGNGDGNGVGAERLRVWRPELSCVSGHFRPRLTGGDGSVAGLAGKGAEAFDDGRESFRGRDRLPRAVVGRPRLKRRLARLRRAKGRWRSAHAMARWNPRNRPRLWNTPRPGDPVRSTALRLLRRET